jgi:choline kinase
MSNALSAMHDISQGSGALHNVISRSLGEPIEGLVDVSAISSTESETQLISTTGPLETAVIQICEDNLPGWRGVAMNLKRLDGLSNSLFRVSSGDNNVVLVRLYGQDVSSFYDPVYELEVFGAMSSVGIGPKMIAHGEGWRIEEFHNGRALLVEELQNPSVFTQVASQLARLHKLASTSFLPSRDRTRPISLYRLGNWTEEGLHALEKLGLSEERQARLGVDKIITAISNMEHFLTEKLANPGRIGYDIVFCHNDVQENNILTTPYGLRLIDFEYADFNFQAADIGNFFNEFTIDNIDFKGMPEKYPSVEAQRLFATVYLSEYLGEVVLESTHSDLISELIEAIKIGSGISHLTWGVWSLVRAQHGKVDGFDFVEYAQYRFDKYFENTY